jgi:hypothetical protein
MTVRRVHPSLIDSNNTSDGSVLIYSAANGVVEFGAASGGGDVANTWVNANDYTTYLQAQSNDYSTLLEARSNDYATLLEARSNDYSTYTTLTANIYDTYTSLSANIGGSVSNDWVNANDYNTLLTARANDYNTILDTRANDYSTFTTLTANIYDTYAVLSSQTSSGISNVVLGNTDLSNASIAILAGNGIAIAVNVTTSVATFSTSMSNVTSQIIEIDGTANTFALSKPTFNTHMVLVSYNGLLQDPRRYVLVNNSGGSYITINNSAPLISDSNLEVRYFDFFDLPGGSSESGGGWSFQGTVSGYSSGGSIPGIVNIIDKFSFSSDGNATDVGDLTQSRWVGAGQSSSVSGYTSGGIVGTPEGTNTIDKFPFATNTNATDVGDLSQSRGYVTGQSSSSSGYSSGGMASFVNRDTIDKFPFATDGNATDVGDLTTVRRDAAGQSSSSSGYTSGGYTPPGVALNTIDKFPFAADGNASDVGDLTQGRDRLSLGQSSTESGYTSGGAYPSALATAVNTIDKFPFSSDSNATDVGDLSQARYSAAGQSSTASGYTSGGATPTIVNTIDKFPFATDTNASDVGDLTQSRSSPAGQQV